MLTQVLNILTFIYLVFGFDVKGIKNVSLLKWAEQSSQFATKEAIKAVDGQTGADGTTGFCAQTKRDNQAWWKVDLGQMYAIEYIQIFNRVDCCSERLANFKILLGYDDANYAECFHMVGEAGVEPRNYTCYENMSARYVKIQLEGRAYLSLCEVQVYAEVAIIPASFAVSTMNQNSRFFQEQTETVKESDLYKSSYVLFSSSTPGGIDDTQESMIISLHTSNDISQSNQGDTSASSGVFSYTSIDTSSPTPLTEPYVKQTLPSDSSLHPTESSASQTWVMDFTSALYGLELQSSHTLDLTIASVINGLESGYMETSVMDMTSTSDWLESQSSQILVMGMTSVVEGLESQSSQTGTIGGLLTTATSPSTVSTSGPSDGKTPSRWEVCTCRCKDLDVPTDMFGATKSAIALRKELTMNTKNLSKTIREKISAKDKNVQSTYIGSLGICVLFFTFAIIVFFDSLNVISYINTKKK